MHKAIQYFNEMANLEGQGVPINWQGVARQMAVIVANEKPAPLSDDLLAMGAQTPAPLPDPPM